MEQIIPLKPLSPAAEQRMLDVTRTLFLRIHGFESIVFPTTPPATDGEPVVPLEPIPERGVKWGRRSKKLMWKIAHLVARGKSLRQIADRLGLTATYAFKLLKASKS